MEENPLTIQVVFFDVVGTILELNGSVGEIYSKVAYNFGLEVEPEKIERRFFERFPMQPPLAFPGVKSSVELHIREYEWWRRLGREVFAEFDFPRFNEFFRELFEFFRSREAWRLYDDVQPAFEALKSAGMRLAVISNFDSRIDDILLAFKLDRYFDGVHISSRIGASKPDSRIFRAALQYHGKDAHQALHIGDSLREDVEGAAAVGMKSILIDRKIEVKEAMGGK
jgi:putative hydrolase of the HAD superfamily